MHIVKREDKILHLLKDGNKLGLELLFKQFYRPLVVYASNFVNTEQEAEDLVQEVFISFWEGQKFGSVHKYIRGYLYSSVKNKCLNYRKKVDRVPIYGLEDYSESLFDKFPDDNDFNEKIVELKREVDQLPERTKEIFIAVYFNKLSYSDVAEDLNISKNTVKTTLARAMKVLRERLSPEAYTILLLLL